MVYLNIFEFWHYIYWDTVWSNMMTPINLNLKKHVIATLSNSFTPALRYNMIQ